jgi:hypothetical protein
MTTGLYCRNHSEECTSCLRSPRPVALGLEECSRLAPPFRFQSQVTFPLSGPLLTYHGFPFKGIVQRFLRGVNTKLK